VWTVKTKGAEAAAAARVKQVDFSGFYKKFGAWDEDGGGGDGQPGDGAGAAGGPAGSHASGRRR
jgi:hypothetical protein